jgi:hypothetical protein
MLRSGRQANWMNHKPILTAMSEPHTVAGWHKRLLDEALEWRAHHPDFRFGLRTGEVTGQNRLAKGYYFTGNDRYLFLPLVRPNDGYNKTRTIGFVVRFKSNGKPSRCYLEIAFGATDDPPLRRVYERMVSELGASKLGSKDKYQRHYESRDPIAAFHECLTTDYPRLVDIVRSAGKEDTFFLSEDEF